MKAVFKRELRALLCGVRGWGYAVIVLLTAAVSVLLNNFIGGATRFEINIQYIALGMIPATALAATDAFHAERRQNTERLLYSLPLKTHDIVLGKWFALMIPVAIAGIGLCTFPLILAQFGEISMIAAYASILALTALGMAMMSIGLFLSACTRNTVYSVLSIIEVLFLSWVSPFIANIIVNMFSLNWVSVVLLMMVAYDFAYLFSRSRFIGIIAAAVVEVPVLFHHLSGTGYKVMNALGRSIESLSLFNGLNPFINGLLDGRVLFGWLMTSVLFGFFAVLCIGNRRQAKRRAL